MPAKLPTMVPLQDRHHAVAAVDGLSVAAVRACDGYAARLECLRRVNGSDRRIEVLLRLTEQRLTQLHRSRDVLVHGDAGDDGSDRSKG